MFDASDTRRSFLKGALVVATAMSLHEGSAVAKGSGNKHVVLLGDSILANGAYVGDGPDVIEQVNSVLPLGARATLGAVDGSVVSSVSLQLQIAPEDATHFVISAGGNDALQSASLLDERASSVSETLEKLAPVRDRFANDYRIMLDEVMARGCPIAICTIYDAHFPDPKQRRLASVGLTIFNDCITREASARGLALIDLRLICADAQDLATPIEPSEVGGAKIAKAIAAFASDYDLSKGRCEIFA